jgi:hypothetical protein
MPDKRREGCMPEDASGGKCVADSRWRYACWSMHPKGRADQRVPDKRQQTEGCMLEDASGGMGVPDSRWEVCMPEHASGGKREMRCILGDASSK